MVSIRIARPDDIDQVVALRMQFLREMKSDAAAADAEVLKLTRCYVAERLPKGEFVVWLAEEDGEVVGTAGLVFHHRPPTFGCTSSIHGYIQNVYTVPEYRGRGIATALMRQVLEHIRATGAKRVSLHSSDMGRSIYERLGFRPSKDIMTLNL